MKKLIYYVPVSLMLFSFNTKAFSTDVDYVLNGHDEVQAFVDGGTGTKETVGNLTVKGADVTQADFNSLADRVGTVNGTVTFEDLTHPGSRDDGTTVSACGGFFSNVIINGGMVFRNCPFLTWPDGISGKTRVDGDFIVDNCPISWPEIDGWASTTFFGGFTEVTGDFVLTNCGGKFNHNAAAALTKVGGRFEISNPTNPWSWEMGFKNLAYVGGDFIIDGNNLKDLQWWTLDCLASMQFIGGNVKILNTPNIHIDGRGDYPYGLCYPRYLIDAGVINYAEKDVQIGFTGELIDLATLGGCADGINSDVTPADLPVKTTALNGPEKEATSKISLTDRTLNIESKDALKKVEIFDLSGKSLLQFSNVEAGVTALNVSLLKKGVYIVLLTTTKNDVSIHEIVK